MVEDTKKVETEAPPPPAAAAAVPGPPPVVEKAVHPPPPPEKSNDAKALAVDQPPPPPLPEKSNDAKALAVDPLPPSEKSHDPKAPAIVEKSLETQKNTGGSTDRDLALEKLEKEKRVSLIKAWEDSEKSKAENKACKKLSDIVSWENTRKTSVESKLKDNEERLEKKKAQYAEKMKNKIAMIHKEAEEKRAGVGAKKGEDLLKAEEMAAKFRATGHVPKKILGCFGS